MKIGQIAHAGSKILRSPLRGDLHMSPRLVRIEDHEHPNLYGALGVKEFS
jgi:hypothetical protein